MNKYDNLIVNDARQRKIYDKGYLAFMSGYSELLALARFERRNDISENYTADDNDSFMAGYEFAQLVSTW